jgi:Ca2+-binding EF-hand superfamily protein
MADHAMMTMKGTTTTTTQRARGRKNQQQQQGLSENEEPQGERESTAATNNDDDKADDNNPDSTMTTTTTIFGVGELDEIRAAFALFDVHQTGRIAVADLARILRHLMMDDNDNDGTTAQRVEPPYQRRRQRELQQQLLDRLERHIGGSSNHDHHDPLLSLDEFTKLLTTPHPYDARDAIAQVFDLFDHDHKGYITIDDLKAIAIELGENGGVDDDESFLRQMMHDQDRVTLDEFRSILMAEKSSTTPTD